MLRRQTQPFARSPQMTSAGATLEKPISAKFGERPKYQELGPLLPLDTPFSIQVDPSNVCNFRCVFCPTGDADLLQKAGRPKGMMSLQVFRKIVDDIRGFPRPLRKLLLHKDGEPLANRELPEFIAYAKDRKIADVISMTSNVSLLNRERATAIVDAGLDEITVSVYATDAKDYKALTGSFSNYARIVENVANLHAEKTRRGSRLHIHCKIINANLSQVQREKFIRDFSPIADSLNVHSIMGWSNTFERDMTLGLAPMSGMGGDVALKHGRQVCPSPFKTLAINFNGDISVCCVDWSHGTSVGNAVTDNVVEVWSGMRLRELRLLHLRGRKDEIEACRGCHYVKGVSNLDDLDALSEQLIQKFSPAPENGSGGDSGAINE